MGGLGAELGGEVVNRAVLGAAEADYRFDGLPVGNRRCQLVQFCFVIDGKMPYAEPVIGIFDFKPRLDRVVVVETGVRDLGADQLHFRQRGDVERVYAVLAKNANDLGRRVGLDRVGHLAGKAVQKQVCPSGEGLSGETEQRLVGCQPSGGVERVGIGWLIGVPVRRFENLRI